MATEALQIDALWSGLNNPTNGKSYSGAIVATFATDGSTPKAVWEDKEKTLPSGAGKAQFTLDSNGQAEVFGDGVYVIKVYAPSDTGLTNPLMTFDGLTYINAEGALISGFGSVAELRDGTGGETDGSIGKLLGYYADGDGGGQDLYWNAASTATDNGFTVFKATSITTGRWLSVDTSKLNILHAGALDGSDSATQIQTVIDVRGAEGAGEVTVPAGEFLLSATLDIDYKGISLVGVGNGANAFDNGLGSRLIATHSLGPAIHVSEKRCTIRNVYIGADTTRNSEVYSVSSVNYGVLLEGPDVSGQNGRATEFQMINTTIEDQPSHGFVAIASTWGPYLRQNRIQDNKGHGIYLDNGTLSSRTNMERPAIGEINLNWIVSNGGHGIRIGSDDADNWGFRYEIKNNDIQGNATDPLVRITDTQTWLRIENTTITLNAFSSPSTDPEGTGAIYIAGGRVVDIIDNRYINIDSPAISVNGYVDRDTYAINIENMWVSNATDDLDPAVDINTSYVERVRVISDTYRDIDNLMNGKTGNYSHVVNASINEDFIVNNSTTLTDVVEPIGGNKLAISVEPNEIVMFRALVFYKGDSTADIKLAFTAPSGTLRWSTANGLKQDTSLSVVNQSQVAGSGASATFGASGSLRTVELVGILKIGTVGGLLQMQMAQVVATVADTFITDDSYISAEVTRF